MSEKTDFAMMISSDLIAEVMGRYFNEEMFKRSVKIIDLKSAEDGYVFSLAFEESKHVPGVIFPTHVPSVQNLNVETNGTLDRVKRTYNKKAKV